MSLQLVGSILTISGGDDVGECTANTGKHLECTIPPQPGVFGCFLRPPVM